MALRLQSLPESSGHFTFECKGARPYISRPSRTQQLQNPKIAAKIRPTVEVPEEFLKQPYVFQRLCTFPDKSIFLSAGTANQILAAKEKERSKEEKGKGRAASPERKRRRRFVTSITTCIATCSSTSFPDGPHLRLTLPSRTQTQVHPRRQILNLIRARPHPAQVPTRQIHRGVGGERFQLGVAVSHAVVRRGGPSPVQSTLADGSHMHPRLYALWFKSIQPHTTRPLPVILAQAHPMSLYSHGIRLHGIDGLAIEKQMVIPSMVQLWHGGKTKGVQQTAGPDVTFVFIINAMMSLVMAFSQSRRAERGLRTRIDPRPRQR